MQIALLISRLCKLGLIGLMGWFLLHTHAFAWDDIYTLPSVNSVHSSTYFPELVDNGGSGTIRLFFSENSVDSAFAMPVFAVGLGNTLRINIVIPPGVARFSLSGKSNQWQGRGDGNGGFVPGTYPIIAGSETDPGEFCNQSREVVGDLERCRNVTGNFVFPEELAPAGGGLNLSYTIESDDNINESFVYFTMYHQSGSERPFTFANLTFLYIVTDIDVYNNWRARRILGINTPVPTPVNPDPEPINPIPVEPTPTPVQPTPDPTPTPVIVNNAGENSVALEPIVLGNPSTVTDARISFRGRVRDYETQSYNGITQDMEISEDDFLSLYVDMIPDVTHGPHIDILLLAAWMDEATYINLFQGENSAIWRQKQFKQNFFNDHAITSWVDWSGPVYLESTGEVFIENITPYSEHVAVTNTSQIITLNLGAGRLHAPPQLGDKGRFVTFFAGYRSRFKPEFDLPEGIDDIQFFVLSNGFRVFLEDFKALMPTSCTLPLGVAQFIEISREETDRQIAFCSLLQPNEETEFVTGIALNQFDGSSSGQLCQLTGLEEGAQAVLSVLDSAGITWQTSLTVDSEFKKVECVME